MKIAILFLFLIRNASAVAQYPFEIKGSIPDLFNNKKIYLVVWDRYSDHKYIKRDSATIKNNSFSFSGTINKPSEEAQIYIKHITGFYAFVIDTGFNQINVGLVSPKSSVYKNKLSNAEVVASRSNELNTQIYDLINHYYQTKAKPSVKNKNILQLDQKDATELIRKEQEIIRKFPNTYYSLIRLYLMVNHSVSTNDLMDVYNSFNKELKSSPLALEFCENIRLKRSVTIGNKVGDFAIKTDSDSLLTAQAMLGKTYLLAFGATWCKPCKERLPMLKHLHQKYNGSGFQVVYVNLDEQTDTWKKQIAEHNMKWINVSERVKWQDSRMAKLFHVTAVPFYLVIDQTGKIVYNPSELKDFEYKQLEKSITKSLD